MAAKVPQQKIADCRELYLRYGGGAHERIASEMRERGWRGFTKRNLYARTRGGIVTQGWPERFGWDGDLPLKGARGTRKGRCGTAYASRRTFAREHTPLRPSALESPKPKFNRQKAKRLRRMAERRSKQLKGETRMQGIQEQPGSIHIHDSPDATDSFQAWLKTLPGVWNWDLRHQLYLYEHLQKVTDGECKRLMIFMPPRHGKSELVTVRYAAWRLKQKPSTRVILSSYNQKLADLFSRKIRTVLADSFTAEAQRRGQAEEGEEMMGSGGDGEKRSREDGRTKTRAGSHTPPLPNSSTASPFPFTRSRPANRVSEWETNAGGGLKAVGVGAGVTGYGADLIIIDDPVKGRSEAGSPVLRERLWNWFRDDLSTRLEPEGSIILIQTRWHEDDLAGRLLREQADGGDQWTVIRLPALAETWEERVTAEAQRRGGENDSEEGETSDIDGCSSHLILPAASPSSSSSLRLSVSAVETPPDALGRSPGEALWPERFSAEYFERLRERVGELSFASLYQQRPVPADGDVFKREWFRNIVDQAPAGLKWKRGYDLAISTKRTADYTASFRIAFDAEGYLYIDGGYRRRIGFPEQTRYISECIRKEQNTEHGIESALHGRAFMQVLRRDARLNGRSFRGVDARGDKLERAGSWISLADQGRIRLVRGHWIRAFVEELCAFPHGKHDDQVDAVSIAMSLHENPSGKLFFYSPNNPNGEIRRA